jgi:hypothetical protein
MKVHSSIKTLVAATALAIPFMTLSVKNVSAQQEDLSFTVVNRTGSALQDFYLSPTGLSDWEDDILGRDMLYSGESATISVEDGRRTCLYDLRGVFADGEVLEDYRVNLCDLVTYEFVERGGTAPVRALW